jgi:polyhydroxyalkanoate synthase
MGGLLALALAHRAPQKISKLAMLATPWDFSAMPQAPTRMLAASMPSLRALVNVTRELPVDVIQAMFASLDPGATASKFRRFAAVDPRSDAAAAFVRLERWLNDGVPLAANVALECLEGWYIENRPGRGQWQSGGRVVDPSRIATPALNIVPSSDIIVPPASAAPLGQLMPNAETLIVDAGHIGMVAGSAAERVLYEPLVSWLSESKA